MLVQMISLFESASRIDTSPCSGVSMRCVNISILRCCCCGCRPGYIQRQKGVDLFLPPQRTPPAYITISPVFDQNAADSSSTYIAPIDAKYGTLHTQLKVPATATLREYTLSLLLPDPDSKEPQNYTVATATFTAGDPRPPTAQLNMTAQHWVSNGCVYVFTGSWITWLLYALRSS